MFEIIFYFRKIYFKKKFTITFTSMFEITFYFKKKI